MAAPSKEALKELERAVAASSAATLPEQGEFYYYRNFTGFKEAVEGSRGRIQQLLSSLPAAGLPPPAAVFDDADEAGEWVTGVIDATLEQLDDALVAARAAMQQQGAAPPAGTLPAGVHAAAAAQLPAGVQAVAGGRRKHGGGEGSFQAAMNSQLQRPQEGFADALDNSRGRFQHKMDSLAGVVDVEAAAAEAAAAAAAGAPRPHPLQARLDALRYPAWQLEVGEARPPRGFDATPFTFIDTVPALRAAAERLAAAKEIAVDLEAHSYRSFQAGAVAPAGPGFCCLMQISTRSEDMIIDSLALRQHIGPALAPVFADPGVLKVLHGADSDVGWLQRDHGLFLVNMFDTGQAARVLEMKGHGLAHLLDLYCAFKAGRPAPSAATADKRFQLADWRVRPLSEEMLGYARADTHHLLHCYDRLKAALVEAGDAVPEQLAVELPPGAVPPGTGRALATVLERSRRLCLLQYEKEQYSPAAFMDLFTKLNATLSDEQLSVFAALYEWRDATARQLDESIGYVLSRAQLLKAAQAMPRTAIELHRAVGRSSEVVSRQAGELLALVQAAQQPGVVAAVRELRQSPWKQALAEQQHLLQPARLLNAGGPKRQEQAAVAAPAAAGVAAAPAKRPALQPRAVKPLSSGGSGTFAAAAAPAAAPASAVPEAATEPAAPALAARTALSARAVKPLSLQQRPAAGGLFGAAAVVAAPAAHPSSMQQQPVAARSFLGRVAPSGAAALLSAAVGGSGSGSGTLAAAAAVKANFALPFRFAARTGAAAVADVPGAAPAAAAEGQQGVTAAAAAAAGPEGGSPPQRDAIRAAVEAMRQEGQASDGAQPQQACGAAADTVAAAAPGGRAADTGLGDFMPLPVSERYGKGSVKRRQAQPAAPGGGKKARRAGQGPPRADSDLHSTMVELGLEDASEVEEEGEEEEADFERGRAGGRQQRGETRTPGQAAALDYSAARSKFDLGIVNPHALPREDPGGRGRGGRGRGRGGQGGRGAAREEAPGSRVPPGKFNPYALPEVNALKGGKRSAVHVRSGNRSMTFH